MQLFKRITVQFDKLYRRKAFFEQYKAQAPFADGFGEFDEARAVVADLIAEYEAAEDANYLTPNLSGAATEKGAAGIPQQ